MRRVLIVAAALMVAACQGDVRSERLTPELIEDQARIERVSNRLDPEERRLFGAYLLRRSYVSSGYVKPIVNAEGNDPATVGEALEIMAIIDEVEAERDRRREAADAKMQAVGIGNREAYSAAVAESNAALEWANQEIERRIAALE